MRGLLTLLFLLSGGFMLSSQAQVGRVETGIASYYHDKFVGRKTASGEIYSQDKMTAAHKSLPLGTWVKVTNLSNDSTVIVKINDRMPKSNGRSIDLTELAASKLNYLAKGLTKVRIEVIPAPTAVIARPNNLPETPVASIPVKTISVEQRQATIISQPSVKNESFTEVDTSKEKKKRRL